MCRGRHLSESAIEASALYLLWRYRNNIKLRRFCFVSAVVRMSVRILNCGGGCARKKRFDSRGNSSRRLGRQSNRIILIPGEVGMCGQHKKKKNGWKHDWPLRLESTGQWESRSSPSRILIGPFVAPLNQWRRSCRAHPPLRFTLNFSSVMRGRWGREYAAVRPRVDKRDSVFFNHI